VGRSRGENILRELKVGVGFDPEIVIFYMFSQLKGGAVCESKKKKKKQCERICDRRWRLEAR
jgi:hypothetical protein